MPRPLKPTRSRRCPPPRISSLTFESCLIQNRPESTESQQ
ncbi:hypothetical protein DES44_3175 [Roseateles depolymerans]|uniref:Uncharacterized protein n=1 Tax=Roseateles depolymerans TaxID=76731 RepID=A0A0U3MAI7_9BURK|nr:hypothetical protein RD2015_809 [Roseateles depolymerans]REG14679.1 hypothetical protein DES44_3175 [Roseateles depolymerans]